jgi:hypothetical protein
LRLNPYPPYYRTAFAFSLLLYPLPHRLALRFAFPGPHWRWGRGDNRLTTFRRCTRVDRTHLYAGGSPSAPEEFEAPGPGHLPFGPSVSAACIACSVVTTPTMLYLGWPYHSILVPDHLAAGSRSYGSRLGCPPEAPRPHKRRLRCPGAYYPGMIRLAEQPVRSVLSQHLRTATSATSCRTSGSRGALLPPGPLRTVRAPFRCIQLKPGQTPLAERGASLCDSCRSG